MIYHMAMILGEGRNGEMPMEKLHIMSPKVSRRSMKLGLKPRFPRATAICLPPGLASIRQGERLGALELAGNVNEVLLLLTLSLGRDAEFL